MHAKLNLAFHQLRKLFSLHRRVLLHCGTVYDVGRPAVNLTEIRIVAFKLGLLKVSKERLGRNRSHLLLETIV